MKAKRIFLAISFACIALFMFATNNVEASSYPSSDPIYVNNAGIVLCYPYLQLYFKKLGLVESNKFISKDTQKKAVYCLHYLVTGHVETNDHDLCLNKIICGLSPYEPIKEKIEITTSDEEISDRLISAIISNWPVISSFSIDKFRCYWLQRDGKLIEEQKEWSLTVQRKTYDVLLDHYPCSYSFIFFPWMDKPIYVNW